MDEFLNMVRDEIALAVQKEIKKYMKENKYEKPYDGTVVSVSEDGTTATVDLKFITLENLKNKTGEQLNPNGGDAVVVYAKGGNINNAYIGLKF